MKEHLPKQDHLPSSEANDPRIDAALQEYFEQLDGGVAIEREAFLARYPEITNTLRNFIAAEEELRKLAGDKASRESAGVTTQSFAAQDQETVPPESRSKISPGTAGSGLQGQFGRYQIIRALGKGSMGAVYLAQDTQLKRYVAIKTPHFEDDPTGELLKRFYREAEAAATLRHANICPVHDVGEIEGKHFISMAYIEGRPLSDLIKSGKAQSERHILIAVHKLARALQQAHDHGIVHRDLKPANIMVDNQGEPLVMDFGLARKRRADGEASLTHSGVLLGSPAYMSPEQIERDPDSVGPASDQYSLGVVLYEMLTGQLPFRGSVVNVLAQIITKGPIPPSELRAGLDPRIEAVCLRMMAKKASDRFPSMKAVADQLAAIVKNPAAAPTAAAKSPAPSLPPAPAASSGGAGASQIRESAKQKALTESDLTSLEELVRKCLRRRDYDQAIQIVERIPEKRRNAALQTLLEKAREKVDAIAFLICDIDEADRLKDKQTALQKAEELLKIKPAHHRAKEVQEKYSGYGGGGATRLGPLSQFTRPWSEGGWIPWSVLASGLAVFAGIYGVIVIYLGNTAIVVDIKDPGVEVAVKRTTLTITGPNQQSVKVEPGDQQLKISYAGLETLTRSFELKTGQQRTVKVSLIDKNKKRLAAEIDGVPLELTPLAGTSGPEQTKAAAVPKLANGVARQRSVTGQPQDAGAAGSSAAGPFEGRLAGETRTDNGPAIVLAWIPPGEFTMGSPNDEKERFENENQARVKFSNGFWLGQHEVTHAEWRRVMPTIPWNGMPWVKDGDKYPVSHVSWNDARKFCEQLTDQERTAGRLPTGWQYTLPTEAQWEYACRAGTTTRYSFGDDESQLPQYAWFAKNAGDVRERFPHEVAQKKANAWGLYDMHGNVYEWCRDLSADKLSGNPDLQDPSDTSNPIFRGGSFRSVARYCRSANRSRERPINNNNMGFRVACDATGGDQFKSPSATGTSSLNGVSNVSADPNRRAAEAVLRLGGSISVRIEGEEREIQAGGIVPPQPIELTRINLADRPGLSDAALEPLQFAPHLVAVSLDHSPNVGDSGLGHLRTQADLRELKLYGTRVTDAGIAILENLPHLELLGLGGTRVTDAGLAHIERLTDLKRLWLGNGPQVTDAGLVHLRNLTKLRDIRLWGAPLNGPGLKYLKGLQELEFLGLSGTNINDEGLANLQDLRNLRSLSIGTTRVTDAGLLYLRRLTNLRYLGLDRTRVSDVGVKELAALSALEKLNVTHAKVTQNGIATLHKSLPHCRIIIQ